MSTILVTGGAGFIGSHLCDRLLEHGHAVTGFDDLSTGTRQNVSGDVELVQGDVADPDAVKRLFAGRSFDAVLHVAGQASIATSFSNPERDLVTNVLGTLNVAGQCVAHSVPRLVYASSMTVYGDPEAVPTSEDAPCQPVSYYGVTKLAAERYVHITGDRPDTDLAVTSLRMFNVYGERQSLSNPYQGVLAIFIGNVLRGEPITIHSDGLQTRDFVYVGDATDAWMRVLETPAASGRIFNVGSGRETSIAELADAVVAGWGERDWEIRRGPAQKGDQRRAAADVTALAEAVGWKPQTPLEEGMGRTIDWARSSGA